MLTIIQQEVLTGLMLGDGSLEKRAKNAALRIVRSLRDKDYILYHMNIFSNIKHSQSDLEYFDIRTNKTYYKSTLYVSCNKDFTDAHSLWYVNRKKSIPKDLKLTPTTLATWFADDGCVTIRPGKYEIKLATQGFSKEEVLFLQEKLNKQFTLNFKMYQDNSGKTPHWTLRLINKFDVKQFIDVIDKYFPEAMSRKSDIWRNNMHLFAEKHYPSCKFCGFEKVHKYGLDNKKTAVKFKCTKCNRTFQIKLSLYENQIR